MTINYPNIAYEEWREDQDEEEEAYMARQERSLEIYRAEKLYGAVGTFAKEWAGNVKFFDAKRRQDYGWE